MNKNQKILCFLQSLVFIPVLAAPFSLAFNSFNFAQNKTEIILKERAEKIDAYFASSDLPLAGQGRKMAEVANEHNLDWRIIPAIAMRESTGGKFACKSKKAPNNPFGWGSCKIGFESLDKAIETIGYNLAGKNPVTASYYVGDLEEILNNYNGYAVPRYAKQVIAIMETISPDEENIG